MWGLEFPKVPYHGKTEPETQAILQKIKEKNKFDKNSTLLKILIRVALLHCFLNLTAQ